MGRKRRRSGAQDEEQSEKSTSRGDAPTSVDAAMTVPAQTNNKKKRHRVQLKVIGVKQAEPARKVPVGTEKSSIGASPIDDESEPSAKKKKKNKKKTKHKDQNGDFTLNNIEAATKSTGHVKKVTAEIDDLFASLKTKKQVTLQAMEQQQRDEEDARKQEKKERLRLQEQIKMLEAQNTNSTAVQGKNPEARPVRHDEDGLPIYTEDSLQINKGGDTADCPFDCWCCF